METGEKCIICGSVSDSLEGINILGKFICTECEGSIVACNIDKVEYDRYKESIKENIWEDNVL